MPDRTEAHVLETTARATTARSAPAARLTDRVRRDQAGRQDHPELLAGLVPELDPDAVLARPADIDGKLAGFLGVEHPNGLDRLVAAGIGSLGSPARADRGSCMTEARGREGPGQAKVSPNHCLTFLDEAALGPVVALKPPIRASRIADHEEDDVREPRLFIPLDRTSSGRSAVDTPAWCR